MIKNPILPGFNPDACAVQVEDNYYIATSTFEWYPGICIYHSKDLANWQIVSMPVKEINFKGDGNSGGLWAPHLSYADGLFWLVVTDVRSRGAFKDTLNFVTKSESIDGYWSVPAFVNASGFDPALFHDDDGKKYFMNMLWDYRPGHESFAGIVMQEYDYINNRLIGKRKLIYKGTDLGVAEGPQIFKKDNMYYLVTAQGGTGYNHAASIARSADIWGPYETSPYHPLLTSVGHPENPLQKSGHVSFLQVGDQWFITHICARPLTPMGSCVLGRETALQRIIWQNGWPILEHGSNQPKLEITPPACVVITESEKNKNKKYDFNEDELSMDFQSLRMPVNNMSLTQRPGWLRLYGKESIISNHEQSLVARRWQNFSFRVETAMDFSPDNFHQMAGLALFYNTENFFYAYKTAAVESTGHTVNLMLCEHGKTSFEAEAIEIPDGTLYLAAEVNYSKTQFSYSINGINWSILGGVLNTEKLSDEYIEKKELVFTGSMIALCCQDMHDRTIYADFDYLDYQEF